MKEYQSLSHTRWDCKYHVVYIPKRRKKRIMVSLVGIWAKCFMSWRSNADVRLWKVT